jgi:site-specific DNA-methyltransferase (adenine-specific)
MKLINGDCMEYMKGLDDNSFELAIVDPPYGIGMSGGKIGGDKLGISKDYKNFAGNDLCSPAPEYFLELKRVSKNQIIWGANHFISKMPFDSPCWIVWDKQNTGNFADSELAYTSFNTAVRNFRFTWNGMIQGDMKNKELRIHPTQKPVKLYEWLLSNYAKEGDRILDTHLGSGSSAIAAHYGGFDFTGCELDKDYFEAAKARIDRETSQIAMF